MCRSVCALLSDLMNRQLAIWLKKRSEKLRISLDVGNDALQGDLGTSLQPLTRDK